ncbi:MAG: hypothetical protein ACYDD4_06700 [Acidimicrobiales bacterium]
MAAKPPSARRWFDSSQPQTLQGAVMLCYITAAFGLLSLLLGGALFIVPVLLAVGGFGVANEKRWGYMLAVALALLNVLVGLIGVFTYTLGILNLLFDVVLAALLLHPHSREYQRIWFR